MFADDLLIIMKANAQNVDCLKRILDSYWSASGKMVNVDKPSILFSPSTNVDMRVRVFSTLQIMTGALNDKYLGLPATLGLDKCDSFQYLLDRLILGLFLKQ